MIDRPGFDQAQRRWAALRGLPGFVGQWGGWSRDRPGVAHIFGCWASRDSYQAFMANAHDPLSITQRGTYRAIEVRLFDRLMDIGAGDVADISGGPLVRLAHVIADRASHPVAARAQGWNTAMRASGGCGGIFAQRDDREFLVLSGWRSPADYARYITEGLPASCACRSNEIEVDLVDIEPAWAVSP